MNDKEILQMNKTELPQLIKTKFPQLNKLEFSKLNDLQIESALKTKSQDERKLTLEIIDLLAEMEARKIYLKRGFGSLIEYCIKELKYSESSAYRRISAMRVVVAVPETKLAIESGALNLSTVSRAQTFFRNEAKNLKSYSKEKKMDLLSQLQNKSAREAEKILLKISPQSAPAEKVRQISEDKTQVTLVLSEELLQKLDRIKNLLSHGKPNCNYSELIEILADMTLKKLDPTKSRQRETDSVKSGQQECDPVKSGEKESDSVVSEHQSRRFAPPTPVQSTLKERSSQTELYKTSLTEVRNVVKSDIMNISPESRHIPAALRRAVWLKSGGRCCYKDKDSGRVCGSKKFLEVDHIHPWSQGGLNNLENLQILCGAHNRFKGVRVIAPE